MLLMIQMIQTSSQIIKSVPFNYNPHQGTSSSPAMDDVGMCVLIRVYISFFPCISCLCPLFHHPNHPQRRQRKRGHKTHNETKAGMKRDYWQRTPSFLFEHAQPIHSIGPHSRSRAHSAAFRSFSPVEVQTSLLPSIQALSRTINRPRSRCRDFPISFGRSQCPPPPTSPNGNSPCSNASNSQTRTFFASNKPENESSSRRRSRKKKHSRPSLNPLPSALASTVQRGLAPLQLVCRASSLAASDKSNNLSLNPPALAQHTASQRILIHSLPSKEKSRSRPPPHKHDTRNAGIRRPLSRQNAAPSVATASTAAISSLLHLPNEHDHCYRDLLLITSGLSRFFQGRCF
jgi:hypothetical protein